MGKRFERTLTKVKASLRENYLGKRVPVAYQKRYGKEYDEKDIDAFAYAVVRKRRKQ